MKSKRHNRILEIINKKEIETQEELAEELKKSGFEVTQATISRDIKILKLLKVQSISGKYRYVAPTKEERNINDKLFSILANSAISVEKVDKFVVVKTLTGAASAAAEAIDSLYSEDIAGTIAGDNTIFILIRTDEKALELITKIRKIILYIAQNFGNEVALEQLDYIEKKILELGNDPYIGTDPRYLVLKRQGYKVLILKKDLVFYKINEENKTVIVYAVVDGRQDYLNIIRGL